jgi:hypothetical protein
MTLSKLTASTYRATKVDAVNLERSMMWSPYFRIALLTRISVHARASAANFSAGDGAG